MGAVGIFHRMADLEEHAFKRDRRFIVRIVTTLSLAIVAGLLVWGQLTSRRTAGCAAGAMLGAPDDASPNAD